MPKGGRLVFKGGEPAMSSRGKKKDKLKRKRDKALARTEAEGGVSSTAAGEEGEEKEAGESVGAGAVDEQQLQPPQEEMRPVSGTGRITSSGTAVQGHEAKFMEELHAGDAILITHPTTLREETRIVKMVLSNMSIGISSPFSSDLISTTKFRFIRAPRVELSAEAKKEEAKRQKTQEEDSAFGTYAGAAGKRLVYRERTPQGNYRIIERTVDEVMTREQMLDMRSKKKADRHCN
ncbi:unnamed protein product [Ascophyllum nodosum]